MRHFVPSNAPPDLVLPAGGYLVEFLRDNSIWRYVVVFRRELRVVVKKMLVSSFETSEGEI
jgi:hypothetical protein